MKTKSASDKIISAFAYIYMILFVIVAIIPFMTIISTSITDEQYIRANGFDIFPHKVTWSAYKYVLGRGSTILDAYQVTTFVTVVGTLFSMLITTMMAFALSRKEWKMAVPISFLVYFTMLFNGGLVPWYIITTKYLGLHDSLLALIIPYTINAFNLLVLRSFISGIDNSIFEAAKIDGANEFQLLFRIALPLALPGLATICLFYAISYWNDWWLGLMLINERELYPLQLLIRAITSNISYATSSGANSSIAAASIPEEGVKMATTVLTIGPIILLYPFLQRYFVKGLTIGSVKG
ncbi:MULTISPECIES: carbohydrate ABC transporter permease [unclassified Paenibacillus]|uniref:carbohydrate ABC transporter permease n=1 Tax=unclassified Paenibacillus TaxID=185978 RepID=UPI000837D2BA|nr:MULTISPECIES: carbohydrate ABC transporter permease [unclassified Paenibacillus]NWL87761.1 carbohydrate ABC transporter permease [Paenibacillus sp. 79R4]